MLSRALDPAYRQVYPLFFFGFSAGIPILLIFSTLSLWLSEAGVSKSAVTYFSWAALGYSFKFVWAPIVDKLPLPFLSKRLGRRRGWLLLSQILVILSIVMMGSIDPQHGLTMVAIAAVALGFSSATQDILIDSYRIECASEDIQALLSSSYIAGYRIGMIVAGAGALYLAEYLGSSKNAYSYAAWQITYWVMACTMIVGVLTTLIVKEPLPEELSSKQPESKAYPYSTEEYVRFFLLFALSVAVLILSFRLFPAEALSTLLGNAPLHSFFISSLQLTCAISLAILAAVVSARSGIANKDMVSESYISPIIDFFKRYKKVAIWMLLLIGFYRVSDIVMGVIANLFYQDMGYSKSEIASVTKVFGVVMTVLGSFIGGFIALRVGVLKTLLLGAILAATSNLAFAWLSTQADATISMLTLTIAIDNLSAGVAVAAFVAWLSSLTNISFTATQYAIFSSVMTLFPKLFGGYSGSIVESVGYTHFFLFTALIGIPIIFLIVYLQKLLDREGSA